MVTLLRAGIAGGALLIVTAFAWWLKMETPHPSAAVAMRESPLVQARSLKSPLETAQSSGLAVYGMKKDLTLSGAPARVAEAPPAPVAKEAPSAKAQPLPVWLVADMPEFAEVRKAGRSPTQTIEQMRQRLRDSGARQMGQAVRLGVLNLAELLAMAPAAWEAGLATPVGSENRISAMLLTFYLSCLDKGGNGAGVKALIKAMGEGMPEEKAVREFILAGRTVPELEQQMGLAFADAGVELQFTRRGGLAFKP